MGLVNAGAAAATRPVPSRGYGRRPGSTALTVAEQIREAPPGDPPKRPTHYPTSNALPCQERRDPVWSSVWGPKDGLGRRAEARLLPHPPGQEASSCPTAKPALRPCGGDRHPRPTRAAITIPHESIGNLTACVIEFPSERPPRRAAEGGRRDAARDTPRTVRWERKGSGAPSRYRTAAVGSEPRRRG